MAVDTRSRLVNTAFSRVLRDTRIERGLTQLELAERSRVSRENVVRMEGAKRAPTLAMMFKLCDAMQVDPVEFIKAVADRREATE